MRAVLVGGVLGGYLFSSFLFLRFYLLLEGDKENMNLKVSVHCGFDRFQEGKWELRCSTLSLKVTLYRSLWEIRDWLSSLLAFNVSGKEEQGTKPLNKSWGFWRFVAQQRLLLFLFFPLPPDALEGVLSFELALRTNRQVKLMWKRLAIGTVAVRGELSVWVAWELGKDGAPASTWRANLSVTCTRTQATWSSTSCVCHGVLWQLSCISGFHDTFFIVPNSRESQLGVSNSLVFKHTERFAWEPDSVCIYMPPAERRN